MPKVYVQVGLCMLKPSDDQFTRISGCVQYRNLRNGDLIDCRKSSSGQLIVDDDIGIVETEQPLRFVLLVEKDTVFQVRFGILNIKQSFAKWLGLF